MKPTPIFRSLVRKSLSRYWLLLLITFVCFLVPAIAGMQTVFSHEGITHNGIIYQSFESRWKELQFPVTLGCFELFLSVIPPMCVFSYLHQKKENHFFRSLPVTEDTLFRSSVLSGFTVYVIPWAVVTAICTPIIAILGKGDPFIWGLYLQGMIFRLGLYLIFYSMAVFGAVLCGRRIIAIVMVGLFHLFPIFLDEYLYIILEKNLFGLSAENFIFGEYFSPYIYLLEHMDRNPLKIPWVAFGIYVVVSGVLLLLSALLHRKRKDDTVGESLAFPSLYVATQYVFTMAVAFCVVGILETPEILSMGAFPCLIITPFAFFLCRMILLRTKKVFQSKAFLQCGIYILCFVAVIGVFRFDLLGITKKVPRPENVKKLTFSVNDMSFTTEDPEDIRDFVPIHKMIIGSKEILSNKKPNEFYNVAVPWDVQFDSVPIYYNIAYKIDITYTFKNHNRKISRTYILGPSGMDDLEVFNAMDSYFSQGDRAARQVLQLAEDVRRIYISHRYWEEEADTLDGPYYYLSTAEQNALFEALLADVDEGGRAPILQHHNLYGVDIHIVTKENAFYSFYLHYFGHDTARSLIDSIIDACYPQP